MAEKNYQGEVITQTITVVAEDSMSGTTIATLQASFVMSEADYLRLKNGASRVSGFATASFFVVLGYAISLVPKFLPIVAGQPTSVSKWEWITLAIGAATTFGLWLLGRYMPNDQKRVMQDIEAHFKKSPASHQLVRGKNGH